MCKVLVCGGRDFKNTAHVYDWLDKIHHKFQISELIEGDGRGVDRMAGFWARKNRIKNSKFPADWDNLEVPNAVVRKNRFGKLYNANAGFDRNTKMVEQNPHYVICFPGGNGTADTRTKALAKGIEVIDIPQPIMV